MLIGITLVLIVFIILGLAQNSHKKKLKTNPNDRSALLKLFNSCDAPSTYEEAAEYGIKYLENNPDDYEIMNACVVGFLKTKSGIGLRKLLDNRIDDLVSILDDPSKMEEYTLKDKNFTIYANNICVSYASTLNAFKETDRAKYFENKAKSIKQYK